MAEEPTFKIPRDVIEPIIQAQVSAAVVNALADKSRLVEEAVAQVLNCKVGDDGKPSDYRAIPWVQWVMKDCIKRAAKEAIEQSIAGHGEVIRKCIIAELIKKNSPLLKQLVNALTTGMTNPDNLKWRLDISMSENK
jgi:hypothetical protein